MGRFKDYQGSYEEVIHELIGKGENAPKYETSREKKIHLAYYFLMHLSDRNLEKAVNYLRKLYEETNDRNK